MNRVHVLLIGNQRRTEFRAIKPSLTPVAVTAEAPNLPQGYVLVERGEFFPDLVLLLQSYPGEFSAGPLDALRRLLPLAGMGVILGPWCEGEGRSGKPLSGAWRIYWHQWSARWGQQIQRWQEGQCPLWGLPATSIEEDRLLAASSPLPRLPPQKIGLFSLRPLETQWLLPVLKAWGLVPQWISLENLRQAGKTPRDQTGSPARPENPSQYLSPSEEILLGPQMPGFSELKAVLFDATDAAGEEAFWLRQVAACMKIPHIILLVDFPRPELWEKVHPWGVKAVLGKPFALGDLVWHLGRLENDGT